MTSFCTGKGSSDTHALTLNDGRQNPHPSAGTPYDTVTLDRILQLAVNPPEMPKAQAQWLIPSAYHEYDARAHDAQRQNGQFYMLAVDVDRGSPSLATVDQAVTYLFGEHAWRLVYATSSAAPGNLKWRALIPVAKPLTGSQYSAYQAALFDAFNKMGIECDRSLERPGQLVYLPNRGEHYQYHVAGGQLTDVLANEGMSGRAQMYLAMETQARSGTEREEGERSILAAFRRKHSIEELFRVYGYEQQGHSDNWRSPYQQGGSYATKLLDTAWFSLSYSDADAGLGMASANGRYGDQFDLYVHFNCHGDRKMAEEYARQCLAEEDAARLGAATVEHGKELWHALVTAMHADSERIADTIRNSIEVDPSTLNNQEWSIEWPPGIVGELAKWIYLSSSRPVKQYAIAAALYMFGAMGRKYNVNGSGLNLFLLLVGGTGRGKGVVKEAVDRMVQAIMVKAQNQMLVAPYHYEVAVSESGLRKALSAQNPICAYEEELGLSLLPLTSPRASANDIGLRKMLTRLFDSGQGRTLGIKEASDKERKREFVNMPCMTVAGDTQPHVFRGLLGGSNLVDSGFGPRMIPFFYYGPRKHHNTDSANHREPPPQLVEAMRVLLEYTLTSGETVVDVQWGEGVLELSQQFGVEMDHKINADEPGAEMFNRAGVVVNRVAALLAVGENHLNPTITEQCYQYAKQIVGIGLNETQSILATGGAGSGESVRIYKLREAVKKFIAGAVNPDAKIRDYKTPKSVVDNTNIINDRYLLRVLGSQTDFKGGDNRTTEANVRETIKEATAQGIIEQVDVSELGIFLDSRTKQVMYRAGPDY